MPGLLQSGRALRQQRLGLRQAAPPRIYVRRLDSYAWTPLAGTEGAVAVAPALDSRHLLILAPIAPGASKLQLSRLPLDGSAPGTAVVAWQDSWGAPTELEGGDVLIQQDATAFVRLSTSSGAVSAPVKMDAGRPGVQRYELQRRHLPGNRDASRLVPYLPSDFNRGGAKLSQDGRLVAFSSDETGTSQAWLAEVRSGGKPGNPIQLRTQPIASYAWAPDEKALLVEDTRGRLMKVAVSVGASLSVAAPVEVANLQKLRVASWTPLPNGRFLVSLKREGEGDVTRYDMVLNWSAVLEQKVTQAR